MKKGSVNRRGYGGRISRVERTPARGANPNGFAGLLVEGVVTVSALGQIAPAIGHCADDDQIALDDGRNGAPTMSRPGSEFLGQ